jgi:hypothetical protein
MIEFGELFKSFGPVAAFLIFFVWRDAKREDSLVMKLSELEKGRVDDLKGVIAENSSAITENSSALMRVAAVIENCKERNR